MPYTKTTWVDGSTPAIDATNLNNIETGISKAPYGPDASANFVPVWNGTGWTYAKITESQITAGTITNASINAAAAIAYSKLALSNSIVNADIASAAAINASKLLSGSSNIPVGTSFPGSPADGDEYIYAADATNGVYWRFKYILSATKWVFIGGPPLYAEVQTSEASTSTTYVALTTPGPSITLPFAGDYDVAIGAAFNAPSATAAIMSYDIGGTGAQDADGVEASSNAGGALTDFTAASRLRRKAGLGAVTLTAKYKAIFGSGGSVTYERRWISVTPVRK